MSAPTDVGIVVIGRNEGARLVACLHSVRGTPAGIYVDSGSTDGSERRARDMGFEVVSLTAPPGYTAARARNAGLRRLAALSPTLRYVQMVDGDCEVAPGWLETARAKLESDPHLAGVFGRRRERFPNGSIYNMMCDDEWNVPLGTARACGGDVLFRLSALTDVGGYSDTLIAGEELDLCLRLRRLGWRIERIDAEMTCHDVDMSRFSQWWRRAERGGHAFAELVFRHRAGSDPGWVRELMSILFWDGGAIAAAGLFILGSLAASPALLVASAVFAAVLALQWLRLSWRRHRDGMPLSSAMTWTSLIMVSKVAQLKGMWTFWRALRAGVNPQLIEYKS